jgi:proliferating cell nuclear antigen
MWSARIPGSLFAGSIACIKDIVNDVNFDVHGKDGLTMQAMDPSHIALCTLKLPMEVFKDWNQETDDRMVIGVNTSTMAIALSCLDLSQYVTILFDGEKLILSSVGVNRSTSISLNTLTIDVERLEIPYSPPDIFFSIDANEFASLCADALKFGSEGEFTFSHVYTHHCRSVELTIKTIGDLGEASLHYGRSTADAAWQIREDPALKALPDSATYAWKYLQYFSKAKVASKSVQLQFVKDQPLKLAFALVGGGEICFYLAPKYKDRI